MGAVSTSPRSVAERLADTPSVRDVVLGAARAAREAPRDVAPGEAADGGVGEAAGTSSSSAMTHSWVFTGAPGSGRSQAALAFAAALECTGEEPGCGRCRECRAVLEGAHTDVVRVVPQALSIGVDYVRETIIAGAHRLPTVSPWRVVIIEDADRLSASAADALLKTVEEPPSRTVIVFCAPSTDPQDFSTTLRSRCRHVYVPSPSVAEITRLLVEEAGATEHDARLAAQASMRHIGRARRLVTTPSMQQRRAAVLNLAELIRHGDQAFQAMHALVKAMEKEATEAFAEEDAAERERLERSLGAGGRGKGAQRAARGTAGMVKELEKAQRMRTTRRRRDLLDLALVDLAGLYRDALLLAVGATVEPVHPDFSGLAGELARGVGERGLVQCLDAIAVCRRHISENVQFSIATDGLVGRLRQAYGV
ncbi:DNA polymerase III subunit delta' [Corynebacterium mastitidis]|uniref:DNA polymerase III subunit delta' n=1 Tax=Corynebacterium mastitidis TaxID=161890 RepID=UPI003BEEC71F